MFHAPPEVIDRARANMAAATDFDLMEDNALSVSVFDHMRTQWRFRGRGGDQPDVPSGLDYTPLPIVMRLCRVPLDQREQVFEDLRILEDETIRVINERVEKSG